MTAAAPKPVEITEEEVKQIDDVVVGAVKDILSDDKFEDVVISDVESLGVREEISNLRNDLKSLQRRIKKLAFIKRDQRELEPVSDPFYVSEKRVDRQKVE